MSLKKKLIKSFIGVGAMKFLSIPISLLTSIAIARFLGPKEFGQYAFVMALIPLLALPVSGGLRQLLVREVATYAQSRDWAYYNGLLKAAHIWVVGMASLIVVTLWILPNSVLSNKESLNLLPIAALTIPFIGLGAVRTGVIKGLGRPVYSEVPQLLVQPVLVFAFVVGIGFWGRLNVELAILTQVLGAIITFFVATVLFYKIRPADASLSYTTYKLKTWTISLIPFSILALVSTFNAQIGITILGFLGNDEQVAGMRVAERAGGVVVLSLTIVNMVVSPYIVRAYKKRDMGLLKKMLKKSARGSFLLSLPLVIIIFFFGENLIGVAFGVEYVDISYWPVVIIAIAQLFNVFCGSAGTLLTMTGNEKLTLFGQLVAVSLNIIMCISLIPNYGAVGAAIGVSFALMAWNIILLSFTKIKLGINASVI